MGQARGHGRPPGAGTSPGGAARECAKRIEFIGMRKAAGLTQEQLAERLHVDRTTIVRWEAGDHVPQPYLWPKLAKLLQASPERLVEIISGPPELTNPTVPAHSSTVNTRTTSIHLISGPQSMDSDPPSIALIRSMSDSIQLADRKLGGGKLYPTVWRYLRSEIAPCLLDPPNDCSSSDLFSAAASLTEIAGWMAHDGGDNTRARGHFTQAYRLAVAGENAALSANVCASMAHLAIQHGMPDDAERISAKGLGHVVDIDGANQLVARLHAMQARAHAIQGSEVDCQASLEAAHDALSASDDGPEIGWIASFDDASLASESALCFYALGSWRQAEEESRKVVHLRDGDRVRSRALGQLTLANVLAQEGVYDESRACRDRCLRRCFRTELCQGSLWSNEPERCSRSSRSNACGRGISDRTGRSPTGPNDSSSRSPVARVNSDHGEESHLAWLAEGNMQQARKRVSVKAIIQNQDGRVLLVNPTYKEHWDLPGGMAEANEPPRVALAREIAEELAVNMTIGRLLALDWIGPHGPWDDQLIFVFNTDIVTRDKIGNMKIADRELSDFDFFHLSEAKRLLRNDVATRLVRALTSLRIDTTHYGEHAPTDHVD